MDANGPRQQYAEAHGASWTLRHKGAERPGDINQLLGQIEVESERAAKTRVYGCPLMPPTHSKVEAAERQDRRQS